MFYVIACQENDKILFWKYGQVGGLTEDFEDARAYGRRNSADIALARLRVHRTDLNFSTFTVLEIEDKENPE